MNKHVDYSDTIKQIPALDPAGFAPDVSPDQWAVDVRAASLT